MTTIDTFSTLRILKQRPGLTGGLRGASKFLGMLWARWRRARKMAHDARLLQRAPNYLLKDVGLQRIGTTHITITRLPDTLGSHPKGGKQ